MKELRSRITQLVGEASTLFGPGVDVFQTERAIDIVDRIMNEFNDLDNFAGNSAQLNNKSEDWEKREATQESTFQSAAGNERKRNE
jgi:hypothetical protein